MLLQNKSNLTDREPSVCVVVHTLSDTQLCSGPQNSVKSYFYVLKRHRFQTLAEP